MKHLTQAELDALVARADNAEERASFLYGMCCEAQALASRYGAALWEVAHGMAPPRRTAETALLGGEADTLTAARSLVSLATIRGLVLTIEQVPLKPLAMGNYETVVSVRPVRERA